MAIPRFLLQADLRESRISSDSRQTKYLVDNHGFPPGRMLSPYVRGWTEEEVADWLASRPVKGHCNIPEQRRPRGRPRKNNRDLTSSAPEAA